jgi:hypothetical protein
MTKKCADIKQFHAVQSNRSEIGGGWTGYLERMFARAKI